MSLSLNLRRWLLVLSFRLHCIVVVSFLYVIFHFGPVASIKTLYVPIDRVKNRRVWMVHGESIQVETRTYRIQNIPFSMSLSLIQRKSVLNFLQRNEKQTNEYFVIFLYFPFSCSFWKFYLEGKIKRKILFFLPSIHSVLFSFLFCRWESNKIHGYGWPFIHIQPFWYRKFAKVVYKKRAH